MKKEPAQHHQEAVGGLEFEVDGPNTICTVDIISATKWLVLEGEEVSMEEGLI